MRTMILRALDIDTGDLARRIVGRYEIPLISLTAGGSEEWAATLARELTRLDDGADYLLHADLQSIDQAEAMQTVLDGLGRPLELVISVDTTLEPFVEKTRSGRASVCDYYRQRGLLRRVRGEGSKADLLATVYRVVEDTKRAQRTSGLDPFDAMLRAIADSAPVTRAERQAAEPIGTDAGNRPAAEESESENRREGGGPGPGWKRTAQQRGRLRRRSDAGKRGFGGRKP